VSEYGLADARPAGMPAGSSASIEFISKSEKLPDVGRYHGVIGQLMYLIRGSRPDICFVVSRLSRYVAKPAERHWKYIMQVLRYLKGIRELGTSYGPGSDFKLKEYIDSNYTGDRTDRKSIYGSVFIFYGGPVI
jgi:hypothetical protein